MSSEILKYLPREEKNLPLEPLITEPVLADILGCSRRTLQQWRGNGSGPPFLVLAGGRLVRYRVEDVQEWLQEQVSKNTI
jgi:predicted DNA-binding transcriptional regulator AlpA